MNMKLFAVVIGRKGRHTRYVSNKDRANLHVYTRREQARNARRKILETDVRNTPVHVILFEGGE